MIRKIKGTLFILIVAIFFIPVFFIADPVQAVSEEDLYFDAITLEDDAQDKSDYINACRGYIKLLKKFPDSDNEELHGAALFALGEIWEQQLDRPENGKWAFKEIIRRFPDSSWTGKGRESLERLAHITSRVPSELSGSGRGNIRKISKRDSNKFNSKQNADLSNSLAGLGIGTMDPGQKRSASDYSNTRGMSGLGLGFDFSKPQNSAKGIRGSRNTSGFSGAGLGFMPENILKKRALEYDNLIFGFKFPLPDNDWYFTEDTISLGDDCEVFVFKDFNKKEYDHVPSLNVIIKSFHEDVSVLSAAAIAKKQISNLPDSEIESEKAVMKNKQMYFYRRFRYWSNNSEFVTLQALVTKENLVYIVTGTYTDVDAADVEDDLWRMITEFVIK